MSSKRIRILIAVAALALGALYFLPLWRVLLDAPQYPDGLFVTAYVNRLEGDVREIATLNHYIGMKPLHEAASFERTASVWMIVAMVLLVEGATFIHTRWAVLLVLPAVFFPPGFLADLQYWLHTFGQNLDPGAPLSTSVKPFTPTILGEGGIGQFKTYSEVGIGFWLATACSVLTAASLLFHRRAYKPLHDAARTGNAGGAA